MSTRATKISELTVAASVGANDLFYIVQNSVSFSVKVSTVASFVGNGGGSGNGTPNGVNTQVQFNNSGSFGASANLTFNYSTSTLSVGNSTTNVIVNSTFFTGIANNSNNLNGWSANQASVVTTIVARDANADVFCNNIHTTSDLRLKDNVVTITGALNLVNRMEGKQFTFKGSDLPQYGFIAQEIEQFLPEIITTQYNGYKSINYLNIIAILVESIKELNDKVSKLEGNKNE